MFFLNLKSKEDVVLDRSTNFRPKRTTDKISSQISIIWLKMNLFKTPYARKSLPLGPIVSYPERSPPEKIPLSSFNHFRISTWNSRFFFWKKWNSKMTIMKLARCPTLQSFPHDLTVQKRRLVLPLRNNTTWSWGKPCRLHSKPIFKFIFFSISGN